MLRVALASDGAERPTGRELRRVVSLAGLGATTTGCHTPEAALAAAEAAAVGVAVASRHPAIMAHAQRPPVGIALAGGLSVELVAEL